jgi:hypothetical protein
MGICAPESKSRFFCSRQFWHWVVFLLGVEVAAEGEHAADVVVSFGVSLYFPGRRLSEEEVDCVGSAVQGVAKTGV